MVGSVAVALAWLGIWAALVHVMGIAPVRQKMEEHDDRRERLKRLGKFRYIATFGVLRSGVGFALAMTTFDFASHDWRGWSIELVKFVFLAVFFGLLQGAASWDSVRDPVTFPPNYPSAK